MDASTPPPDPAHTTPDVAEQLVYLMGDTGGLNAVPGGFRIKVYHTRGFPWDDVFKTLLYRDYKVGVTRHKADIYIDATV